jgi:hypothetical protein
VCGSSIGIQRTPRQKTSAAKEPVVGLASGDGLFSFSEPFVMQFNHPDLVTLADARLHIADGDLLLFRRPSLIAVAGRGEHSHAAKAAWWDEELFCLEVREWHGGRAVTLESQVTKFPGRIDVHRANAHERWPEYDRTRATHFMRRLAGCDYGYAAVLAAAMLHLPFVRLAVRAEVDDCAIDRRPPFCSHACAMADRLGGGVDPVPHLADRLTEPADLARSPFYEYRFTLTV